MRLIDGDEMENYLYEQAKKYDTHESTYSLGWIIDFIKTRPTIEAEPVKHAHWVKDKNFDGFKIWKCSNCSCRFGDYISTEWGINPIQYAYGKYCGYCGAKMDEVINNE